MNQFITYIEEVLHIDADYSKYEHLETLPLYLLAGYELYSLTIRSASCLLARPTEQTNLTVLRKQARQLKKLTNLDCVLCLDGVRIYTKEKMLSEGIPFIIAGQQIYMPFLGIALSKNGIRDIPHIEHISFSTQKLLLTAIYQDWKQMTLTETAKALGISKMSVTRIFDELQALDLSFVKQEKKMRRFIWENGRRALWESILPMLRCPVARQYSLSEKTEMGSAKLGGISAVSHYSMLADNSFPVYAVTKDAIKTLKSNSFIQLPDGETPEMVLQVMQYDLAYPDSLAIDPLTAILSLTDEDKNDPRVEMAIERILEVCLRD